MSAMTNNVTNIRQERRFSDVLKDERPRPPTRNGSTSTNRQEVYGKKSVAIANDELGYESYVSRASGRLEQDSFQQVQFFGHESFGSLFEDEESVVFSSDNGESAFSNDDMSACYLRRDNFQSFLSSDSFHSIENAKKPPRTAFRRGSNSKDSISHSDAIVGARQSEYTNPNYVRYRRRSSTESLDRWSSIDGSGHRWNSVDGSARWNSIDSSSSSNHAPIRPYSRRSSLSNDSVDSVNSSSREVDGSDSQGPIQPYSRRSSISNHTVDSMDSRKSSRTVDLQRFPEEVAASSSRKIGFDGCRNKQIDDIPFVVPSVGGHPNYCRRLGSKEYENSNKPPRPQIHSDFMKKERRLSNQFPENYHGNDTQEIKPFVQTGKPPEQSRLSVRDMFRHMRHSPSSRTLASTASSMLSAVSHIFEDDESSAATTLDKNLTKEPFKVAALLDRLSYRFGSNEPKGETSQAQEFESRYHHEAMVAVGVRSANNGELFKHNPSRSMRRMSFPNSISESMYTIASMQLDDVHSAKVSAKAKRSPADQVPSMKKL